MLRSVLSKSISSLLFLFFVTFGNAQQLEIRPTVYSGFFFYRGSAATSTSIPFFGGTDANYYNPTSYGKKSGFSYEIQIQSQWVTPRKDIIGMGLGFERLTSAAVLVEDPIFRRLGLPSHTGKVNLASTNLTVAPFAGHRFNKGPFAFDALVGVDWAINLFVHENLKVITPTKAIYQIVKADHLPDLRARMQINALYKHIGASAGYSLGMTNLYPYHEPDLKNKKAYSNFLRLGVSYRLK